MNKGEKMLHDLKEYFKNTPREEVINAWNESKEKAPKCGPTVKEFIEYNKKHIPDMEFNQDYEDQQREADEIINQEMEF